MIITPYTTAILVYNLYGMLLAIYAISIKKKTQVSVYICFNIFYRCFNLCSNGILSDSTHIRSIISISLVP